MPPGQPTLPAEGIYTDTERLFIQEQPQNLWPPNQDSNFGQIRKVVTDEIQDSVDQIESIFNDSFVDTALERLAGWEHEYGLPKGTNRTVAQRRADIKARTKRTAFTRTRRRQIVEDFIHVTSGGTPISLVPEGVAIGDGLPLWGESGGLIDVNMVDNPNFEIDLNYWTRYVNDGATVNNWERITGWHTHGSYSARFKWTNGTATMRYGEVNQPYWDVGRMPIVPGEIYSVQADINVISRPADSANIQMTVNWYDANNTQVFPGGGYALATSLGVSHLQFTTTPAPVGAVYAIIIFVSGTALADAVTEFYVDSIQFEKGPVPTSFVLYDIVENISNFSYLVYIDPSITPDIVGLTRELARITPAHMSFTVVN